mgnify:CR=1 FL=1
MKQISRHKTAKITLITFYLIQTIFSFSSGYIDMTSRLIQVGVILLGTTFILLPALIAYELKKYMACTAACLALLPFVIYSDIYALRGVPLAGIVIFLVGEPLSIVLAITFGLFERKYNEISTAR